MSLAGLRVDPLELPSEQESSESGLMPCQEDSAGGGGLCAR
jgi:hypothetical protein